MENNADILYPSVTMCSKTRRDYSITSYNMSYISQRSLNMSSIFVGLTIHKKNINGDIEKLDLNQSNFEDGEG